MVDGAVRPRKTFGRKIKSHDEDISTLYGLIGNESIVSGSPSGPVVSGGTPGIAEGKFLPLAGGTMEGTIGHHLQALQISSGNLKLSETGSGDQIKITKNIFVSAEGGMADDLDTIEGRIRPGQEHRLIGISGGTITVKHNNTGAESGNKVAIICPGGVDYIINDTDAVDLFYDDTNLKWRISGDANTGGGGGLSYPLNDVPVIDHGSPSATESINLSLATAHSHKITVDKDFTLTFDNPPVSLNQIEFEIELTNTGTTTAYTVTLPSSVRQLTTITVPASTPAARGVYTFRTNDGGVNYDVIQIVSGTTGSGIPAGTADKDHLEWNGSAWVTQQGLTFDNDVIMLSARNVADDGNLEFKIDSGDFFDFTESNNGPVTLNIRAQHASNPDNTLTITQLSGTTGVGQFFAPNEMQFLGSGSSNVFNYDQNRIETNVNILPDADGTLSIGAVALRYLDMYAAGYKFDINRGLNFNTGGGNITVNGSSDTFTITVDSVLKQTMSATLTTLAGNVDILGVAGVGDKAEFTEITAPITDPGANSGWMYAKDVGGVTQPFWEDESGTVTNMIGGAGGSVNQISQGDSSVTVTDTGTGAIVGKVDNVQKFNISPTSINFDDDVDLGLLSTDKISINGRIDTDIEPSSDNTKDIGAPGLEFRDLYIDGIADIDRLENNGSSIAVGDDLVFDFGDTVAFNESQNSVGSAGFATALPANPTGYLVVKQGSTEVVIPYYDKS